MANPSPPSGPLFVLDIGTRNVVGLLAEPTEEGGLRILDVEAAEHPDRAMRDGQVHDVPGVAARVRRIRQALEERTGLHLTRAAVAAAGRALTTTTAAAELTLEAARPIDRDQVKRLDMAAIGNALGTLETKVAPDSQHCVGYSPIRYLLDGYDVDNPVGQLGKVLQVTVIATFLPRVVADSLVTVLRWADLEMANLTLEPIAAMHAAVPPTMRNLNLAMVDVGAGTSDIAVTREGTVVGYGMVPMAGDAVTEALAEQHLMDFVDAERVKLQLEGNAPISFLDIFGAEHVLDPLQGRADASATVRDLASRIGNTILELNGKAPNAVLMVGGGSLTPGLCAALAEVLGLPAARVGVRGAEMLKAAAMGDGSPLPVELVGPGGITPLGIAKSALFAPGFRFREVQVDDRRVQVLDLGNVTVLEALVAAGFRARQLSGRPGLGIGVTLNGRFVTLPGRAATPARILSGPPEAAVEVTFDAPLPERARLQVVAAVDGDDAATTVLDLAAVQGLDLSERTFTVNGLTVRLTPRVTVNGHPVAVDSAVPDGAAVTCSLAVQDLLLEAGISTLRHRIEVTVDGRPVALDCGLGAVRIYGLEVPLDHPLVGGEEVVAEERTPFPPKLGDLPGLAASVSAGAPVVLNDRPLTLPGATRGLTVNGRPATLEAPVAHGDRIETAGTAARVILADVLAAAREDLMAASDPSHQLVLEVNGTPASFTTPVPPGSRIRAYWASREATVHP